MAFDDLDNFQEDKVNIDLQAPRSSSDYSVTWLNPNNGDNIKVDSLPLNLSLKLQNPSQIKKIDLYVLDPVNKSNWLNVFENPGEDINFSWGDQSLKPGVYKFYLLVTDLANQTLTSPKVIINLEK